MSDKLNQLIELLKLEKIDDLIFRGASEDLGFRQVFGGQVVAQSLSACLLYTSFYIVELSKNGWEAMRITQVMLIKPCWICW